MDQMLSKNQKKSEPISRFQNESFVKKTTWNLLRNMIANLF